MNAPSSSEPPKPYHWILLALAIILALWIRLDDLIAWNRLPQKAFHADRPLLTTFDGYYYLSLARDLQNDTYASLDPLRGVPDTGQPRRFPPLISLMAAGLSTLTTIGLDWISVLLPPLLGVLLAVPLYLFGRLYGGRVMALVATFTGICSSYYVYRSNLGWFDTDCMNATFAFMIAYLFIQFGLQTGPRRFGYLAGGGLCTLLFLLWWDQIFSTVVVISLSPLIIAAALFYRPRGKELWIAAGLTLLVLGGLLVGYGPQLYVAPFKKAFGVLGYISKAQTGDFPNIGVSVFEQKRLVFNDLVQKSTGNLFIFIFGAAGLGWLFWRRRRQAAALGLLFLMGCFSFLFARRFLIFLNPFIAIGLGYMTQQLWNLRRRWPVLRTAVPMLALLVCFGVVKSSLGKVYWPKEIPPIADGIERLASITPADAVVWAWWDHGYPIVYWGQRATINDGSLHSGLRTVCNAIPLASHSQRYAAGFMHFYVGRGTTGMTSLFDALGSPSKAMALIEDVLTIGPQGADALISKAGLEPLKQWHDFFFPLQHRELYLFLDLRLARTTYWWHWFGTWDAGSRSGRHANFKLIRNLHREGNHISGPDIDVNLDNGVATYKQKSYRLSQYAGREGAGWTHNAIKTSDGVAFAFRQDDGVGALMEPSFARTLFSQLFVWPDAPSAYFSLVAESYPYYQIWKVADSGIVYRQ